MKRLSLVTLVLALLLVACTMTGPTPERRTATPSITLDPTRSFVEGQLVVGYREGADLNAIAARLGATVNTHWPEIQAALLDLPSNLTVAKAEKAVSGARGLRYAEPNTVIWHEPVLNDGLNTTLNTTGLEATQIEDPLFGRQWQHRQLKSQGAWDQGVSGSGIRIGIHDEFIDHRHPDLVENVFYPGYDGFADTLIQPDTPHDGIGEHGTWVAGSAAAAANTIGGRGTAYEASIVPLAINDPETGGLVGSAIVNAALFAVLGPDGVSPLLNPGEDTDSAPGMNAYVHIVNMSWGSAAYNQITKDTMDFMLLHGVTLVNSAGNTPTPGMSSPSWYPGIINVAATLPTDQRTSFSNRGKHLSVAAPGEQVLTTATRLCVLEQPDGSACDGSEVDYQYVGGTSFSSPLAAGVAALILEASAERDAEGNITGMNLGPAQVRGILEASAFQPPGYTFEDLGHGIVDAEAAVGMALDPNQWPQPGGSLRVNVTLEGFPNVAVPTVSLSLIPTDAQGPIQYVQTANGDLTAEGQGLFLEVNPGAYTLLASGPHTATTGIVAGTAAADVTILPANAQTVDITLAIDTFEDPFEPNDSVEDATEVEAGNTYRASLFNAAAATDLDYYVMDVSEGEAYRINLKTIAGSFDAFLRVYAEDGTTVLAENDNYEEFSGDPRLDFTADDTGTVFIEVSEQSGSNSPFNLYEIDIATFIGTETEPNGSATVLGQTISNIDFSAAQPVPLGSALDASIEPVGDVDIFAVTIPAGTTLVADTQTAVLSQPDTMIGIYNEAGEQVAFNDDVRFGGGPSRASYTSEPGGVYYVVVVSWDGNGQFASTGDYGLIITNHINP